jgi:NitT/TauT family transport system ATP-binding protein
MPSSRAILSLRGIAHHFRAERGDVSALSGFDLDIEEGEFLAVVGPSGCGKSTLLNILVGLLDASAGKLLFRGAPWRGINKEIGYVTQADNLFPWRTALHNVMFGLEMRGIGTARERHARAAALLDRVGLAGFHHRYRHELSGGMRQRVNIVRTLAYDPKVILLDEPFGPLDVQTRLNLQDLLLRLWQERSRTTIVFVTHDLTEAIALADRVVVMSPRPGRIREVVPVPLPRPRDIFSIHTDPAFRDIYDRLWAHLAQEMKQEQTAPASHAEGERFGAQP